MSRYQDKPVSSHAPAQTAGEANGLTRDVQFEIGKQLRALFDENTPGDRSVDRFAALLGRLDRAVAAKNR